MSSQSSTLGPNGWEIDAPNEQLVTATTNPVTGGSVNIVVSNAAPNNGDGRPDGTIYVQTV